jgi:transcription elongation GreA/GreB family factor
VSKAFTREDEAGGFEAPAPAARLSEGRLTAYGARIARDRLAELERGGAANDSARSVDRLRDLLEGADVLAPAGAEHVALGARVTVRNEKGVPRTVVIVTPDEVGLVPSGISAASPLAQALLGAEVGDTVELELPRGTEELTVTSIEWPT